MKMAERFAQRRDFLGLLKLIAQGEADVRRGKTLSQKRVFARMAAKLTKLQPQA